MAGKMDTKHPAPARRGLGIGRWVAQLLIGFARKQVLKKPRRIGIRELLARARHRRETGDVGGALQDYRVAAVDRSDEIPVGSRASVYLGFVQLLERVNLPEAIRTYFWLADEWRQDGRMHLAIGALRRVVALRPNNPEAHLRLARFLEDDGQTADAVLEYALAVASLRTCNRSTEADELERYIETLRVATDRRSARAKRA